MAKESAGILLFRVRSGLIEFFLVHPGGPFWKNKDEDAWSIPKGEYTGSEAPIAAAKREFMEETGINPEGHFIPLSPVKLKSGKKIQAWALQMDIDPLTIKSNLFELEWPPKSGILKKFPEIDKGEWFDSKTAARKINAGLLALLKECEEYIRNSVTS